jgi:hypothetical protein
MSANRVSHTLQSHLRGFFLHNVAFAGDVELWCCRIRTLEWHVVGCMDSSTAVSDILPLRSMSMSLWSLRSGLEESRGSTKSESWQYIHALGISSGLLGHDNARWAGPQWLELVSRAVSQPRAEWRISPTVGEFCCGFLLYLTRVFAQQRAASRVWQAVRRYFADELMKEASIPGIQIDRDISCGSARRRSLG